MGIGTPLELTFWMPLNEYEPLILGSISLTEETFCGVFCGAIISVIPPISIEVPIEVNVVVTKVPTKAEPMKPPIAAPIEAEPPIKPTPIIIGSAPVAIGKTAGGVGMNLNAGDLTSHYIIPAGESVVLEVEDLNEIQGQSITGGDGATQSIVTFVAS